MYNDRLTSGLNPGIPEPISYDGKNRKPSFKRTSTRDSKSFQITLSTELTPSPDVSSKGQMSDEECLSPLYSPNDVRPSNNHSSNNKRLSLQQQQKDKNNHLKKRISLAHKREQPKSINEREDKPKEECLFKISEEYEGSMNQVCESEMDLCQNFLVESPFSHQNREDHCLNLPHVKVEFKKPEEQSTQEMDILLAEDPMNMDDSVNNNEERRRNTVSFKPDLFKRDQQPMLEDRYSISREKKLTVGANSRSVSRDNYIKRDSPINYPAQTTSESHKKPFRVKSTSKVLEHSCLVKTQKERNPNYGINVLGCDVGFDENRQRSLSRGATPNLKRDSIPKMKDVSEENASIKIQGRDRSNAVYFQSSSKNSLSDKCTQPENKKKSLAALIKTMDMTNCLPNIAQKDSLQPPPNRYGKSVLSVSPEKPMKRKRSYSEQTSKILSEFEHFAFSLPISSPKEFMNFLKEVKEEYLIVQDLEIPTKVKKETMLNSIELNKKYLILDLDETLIRAEYINNRKEVGYFKGRLR